MLVCGDTGRVLAERVLVCSTAWERTRGLIGRAIAQGDCMWIERCNMVHTCFMSYPIDLVFVDASNRVRHVQAALPPWRVSKRVAGADAVLEARSGWIAEKDIRPGQQVQQVGAKREGQAA